MATFNIEVEIPKELAEHFEELHKFQKHIVYQVNHYNDYAQIEKNYNENICVNKFDKKEGGE